MDKLKEVTRNFSIDALIGQSLQIKFFFGVLKDGRKSMIMKIRPTTEIVLEVMAAYLASSPFQLMLFVYQYILTITLLLQVPVVSRFKHENIIQLLGYCVEGDNRFLAYEYASRGSLHDILYGELLLPDFCVLSSI